MFVQTVNLPYFHHADEEALRDQERLESDETEDEMLADDGVEERGDDEEYLQDDGEEEAGAEVIRYALKEKKRYYLGIFPNMGGVFPNPKTFFVNLPSIFLYAKFILRC